MTGVHAYTHGWERVLRADAVHNGQPESDRRRCITAANHQRIAHRLYLTSPVWHEQRAHRRRELGRNVGRLSITVGLGQRREACEVSEQEGVLLLAHLSHSI